MNISRLAFSVALASLAGVAVAETQSFDQQLKLPNTVITASRQAQSKDLATAAITVFTREDIERLQPNGILDLLQRAPGVQITQNGGKGATSSIFIRGMETARTLYLIDGQRINDAAFGGVSLGTLNLEQIERVEITRGGQSAAYGADAIGGVVQIFTRRADGSALNPHARIAYGSHQTWERTAGLSGGNSSTRFSLNLASEDTNGFDRTSTSSKFSDNDRDAFRSHSTTFNISHLLTDRTELGFAMLHSDSEAEYDMSWSSDYPYNQFNIETYSVHAEHRFNQYWTSRIEAGYSSTENIDRGDTDNALSLIKNTKDSAAWTNTLQPTEQQQLLLGVDWLKDEVSNNQVTYNKTSRDNYGLFAQHSFYGEHFSTEIGARHDDNQQFGSHTSWNTALSVPVSRQDTLTAAYREAYRVPTYNQLYYPGSGNPTLTPEKSKHYELKWAHAFAQGFDLSATAYRTNLDNAIEGWPAKNIGQARVDGFELELSGDVLGWNSRTAFSWMDPKNLETGKQLTNRSARTFSLDADKRFGDFGFGFNITAKSKNYNEANSDYVPGYALLNLRSTWYINDELNAQLKVDNVLDKTYYSTAYSSIWGAPTYDGVYQEAGRTAMLALTWSPKF